jgi:hypothetical protein
MISASNFIASRLVERIFGVALQRRQFGQRAEQIGSRDIR